MLSSICKCIFIISFTLFTILVTVTADNNVSVTSDFQSVIQGWITASDKGPDPLCSSSSSSSGGSIDVTATRTTGVGLEDVSDDPNHHHSSTRKTPTGGGNCTNNLTVPHTITRPPLDVDEPVPSTADPSVVTSDDITSSRGGSDDVQKQPIATFDEWTKEKLKQGERKAAAAAAPSISPQSSGGGPSAVPIVSPPVATSRNYASRECGAKVLLSNPEAENTKALLNDKEKDEYMRNPCSKAENKFVVIELCETIQPRRIELGNFELFSSGPKEVRMWASERYPNGEWQLVGEFAAADSRNVQSFVMANSVYAKFVKLELISHHGNEHYCTLSMLKVLGMSMVDEYEIEAEAAVRLPAAAAAVVPDVPVQTNKASGDQATPEATNGQETTSSPSSTPDSSSPSDSSAESATKESKGAEQPALEESVSVSETAEETSATGILTKIVNVVKDMAGRPCSKPTVSKRRSFDMSLCRVCPISATCIVPTHLCWVFVWRPPAKSISRPLPAALSFNLRRSVSARLRRRRIAYLQRMMINYRKTREAEKSVSKPVSDVAISEAPVVDHPSTAAVSPPADVPLTAEQASTTTESVVEVESQNTVPPPPSTDPANAPAKLSKSKKAIPAVPSDSLPATSVSHKESVFMKLNKRIAALELNMSLSSEYLSELSRQYVAQTDEHKKHLEQARRTAQEVAQGVESRLNEIISEKLQSMRTEMDSLSAWLSSMRVAATELSLRGAGSPRKGVHVHSAQDSTSGGESDDSSFSDEDGECPSADAAYLKHYAGQDDDETDGLWTTEQVIYAVIAAQLTTVILMAGLLCYSCIGGRGVVSPSLVDADDLDAMVRQKVQEAVQQIRDVAQQQQQQQLQPPMAMESSNQNQKNKKKKRRKRRAAGGMDPLESDSLHPPGAPSSSASGDWPDESTASQTTATSTATETSSDAESGRGPSVTLRHSPANHRHSPISELELPARRPISVRS